MASAAHTVMPNVGWSTRPRVTPMQSDLLGVLEDLPMFDDVLTVGVQDFRIEERVNRADLDSHFEQWLEDSLFDSLPAQMRDHDSYRAIVAMGERAVPIIAAELRKMPSFLFLALEEITDHNPVGEEAEGDLLATVEAWLEWLRK